MILNRFLLSAIFLVMVECSSAQPQMTVVDTMLSQQAITRIYGNSETGRLLYAHIYGPDEAQKTVFIIGGIHGSEPASAYVVTKFLLDFDVKSVLLKHRLVIVPRYNPDGLFYDQRENIMEVDLNRDFPTANRKMKHEHAAETKAFLKLLSDYPPSLMVSIHQPYRVVNYDGPAKKLATRISKMTGYPVKEYIGYPTPGSLGTYLGIERKIPVITLELPRGKEIEHFKQFYQEVKEALFYCALNT